MVAGGFNLRFETNRLSCSALQVTLVIFDAMSIKEGAEFFLKCSGVVVCPLVFDVFENLRQIRLAHGKCTVAVLPSASTECGESVMNPFRGTAFEQLYHLAER